MAVTLLKPGQTVKNPSLKTSYKVLELLGFGGFGQAYEAIVKSTSERVCIKITPDQRSWHREAYFGELLKGHKRAVQLLDSFVLPVQGRAKPKYALVFELAEHGTVADYLWRTGKAWSPGRVARESKGLLRLLDRLHGASATHRDLTPMNVFCCGAHAKLKLGDFGIARHDLAGPKKMADAFNPEFVTKGFRKTNRPWLTADDVFQMGQLMAVLLLGDPQEAVSPIRLAKAPINPELKSIVKRAVGPRARRYTDAFEMLQALEGNDPAPSKSPRSARGAGRSL